MKTERFVGHYEAREALVLSIAGVDWGHSKRPLIMPTDLDTAVSARKRAEQTQRQTLVTIVLVWVIICLGMLGLLFEVLGRLSGSS
jgi:hypothetical protein